jgi:hypothetical protein
MKHKRIRNPQGNPIIKSRFRKMAEQQIPNVFFRNLRMEFVKLFLTEPNPEKWPKELQHLKPFIKDETTESKPR